MTAARTNPAIAIHNVDRYPMDSARTPPSGAPRMIAARLNERIAPRLSKRPSRRLGATREEVAPQWRIPNMQAWTDMSEERAAQRGDRPTWAAIAGAIALLAAQLIVVVPFGALIILQSFNSDACYGLQTCNYALGAASMYMTPIAALCALVITIPLTVLSGKRGRSVVVAPLCGVLFVVAVGIISVILNYSSWK